MWNHAFFLKFQAFLSKTDLFASWQRHLHSVVPSAPIAHFTMGIHVASIREFDRIQNPIAILLSLPIQHSIRCQIIMDILHCAHWFGDHIQRRSEPIHWIGTNQIHHRPAVGTTDWNRFGVTDGFDHTYTYSICEKEIFQNLSNFLILQRCKSTSSNNASISNFKTSFLRATWVLTKCLQHTWWPCHLQILKWPGTWFLHISKSLPWWRSYVTITKSESSCSNFEICQSWGLQLIFEHYAITTLWASMMLLDIENLIIFYFAN